MEPQSRVDVPVCLSLAAFFSVGFSPFSCSPAVRVNARLIFKCQHFYPGYCVLLFYSQDFFFSFLCVFCKNWNVGNKMRCVYCTDVCEGGDGENRLKINLLDGGENNLVYGYAASTKPGKDGTNIDYFVAINTSLFQLLDAQALRACAVGHEALRHQRRLMKSPIEAWILGRPLRPPSSASAPVASKHRPATFPPDCRADAISAEACACLCVARRPAYLVWETFGSARSLYWRLSADW